MAHITLEQLESLYDTLCKGEVEVLKLRKERDNLKSRLCRLLIAADAFCDEFIQDDAGGNCEQLTLDRFNDLAALVSKEVDNAGIK